MFFTGLPLLLPAGQRYLPHLPQAAQPAHLHPLQPRPQKVHIFLLNMDPDPAKNLNPDPDLRGFLTMPGINMIFFILNAKPSKEAN